MAANLSGMFAQMNNAIQQAPTGGGLLDMASKNFGGLMADQMGVQDRMGFMNEGGRKLEARDQLQGLDLRTVDGMNEAAKIYQQMGDTQNAMKLATMARQRQAELQAEMDTAVAESESMGQEISMHQKATSMARANGDDEALALLRSGAMKPSEYLRQLSATRAKVKEARLTDPYKGAFTDTILHPDTGEEVRVRFSAGGNPIQALGATGKDVDFKEVMNPNTGTVQWAAVNKNNPNNIKFIGETEGTTFDIKEGEDGRFHVFENNPGQPPKRVGQPVSNMTDAEKQMARAQDSLAVANLRSSIAQAREMLDADDKWVGGVYGVLEYLPSSDARTFRAITDSIRSNVGFDALQRLRAAGGTLGQVSNIENMLLQSEIAQLDTWTEGAQLRAALERIDNIYARIEQATASGNPDDLFTAERNAAGELTGNKLYRVDSDTIFVIRPDGTSVPVRRGQ